MEDETMVEPLPATEGKPDSGMEGSMSQAEYAASLVKKAMDANKAITEQTKDGEEAAGEQSTEEAEPAAEAQDAETSGDDGKESEGDEQPEEQPESEDKPVLSKLDPKLQDKFNKRIGKVTARAKEAEEKLTKAEAELAELRSKLQSAPEESAAAPVVVPVDDPRDKTAAARGDDDLLKLEQDAANTIEFVEAHDRAITKAIANDQDTVVLAGREFNVDELRQYAKEAKKHLEHYIPQRRRFLQEQAKAAETAKSVLPELFDKSTTAHQEWLAFQRKNPAIRSVPGAQMLYALAKVGEKYLAEQGKKPAPVKKAAAVAPKAAADTGSASSTAKPRTANTSAERTKVMEELGRAQKAFQVNSTQSNYQKVLILQSRLKKLN